MSHRWDILDTGPNSAPVNMAIDTELLLSLSDGRENPLLHLYDWTGPSATHGYFLDPGVLLKPKAKGSLTLARRPTGGGLIFHLTDWAFSILLPATHPAFSLNTLENYAFVNRLVIEVVRRFNGGSSSLSLLQDAASTKGDILNSFCMAKPTRYDVMVDGRKVAGGAQRRTRFGFLHQGTISLALPEKHFFSDMLLSREVAETMSRNSYTLLEKAPKVKKIQDARRELANLFRVVVNEL